MYKLRALLAAVFSWLLISDFWQMLEKIMYGEIRPDGADTVISIIILGLLYLVYKGWMEKENLQKQLNQNIIINEIKEDDDFKELG